MSRTLLWYRTDLRIHDHEALHRALLSHSLPIPYYCVDPRHFGSTSFGFPKTGSFRAQFLLESITDLRHSLRQRGSDLIVESGLPEVMIPKIVQELHIETITWSVATTAEELAVENAVKQALLPFHRKIQTYWDTTLLHPEDLSFTLDSTPELFTHFRKRIQRDGMVRPCWPTPSQLPSLVDRVGGELPTLEDWGLPIPQPDSRRVLPFCGGETTGLQRLDDYIWRGDRLRSYKETRNNMLNPDDSTKFSPWLSYGCLSPRYIAAEVTTYEQERVKNDSTYWLIFELWWRDYFRFMSVKHGNNLFKLGGLQQLRLPWKQDWQRFEQWCQGYTGFPLVDAAMRELRVTGWISNRGRQNVASFLTKNLGIDWRMGAEWFESLLIDYDVCSNWGNWNYTAGVGNDGRGFRWFNSTKQSKDYDPQGDYLRYWLPELASLPAAYIHEPSKLTQEQQLRYGVRIGLHYPKPIVDLFASAKANERHFDGMMGY